MLFIGVLLLAAMIALGVAAVGGGGDPISFHVLNNTIETTGATTFLVGAVAGAVLVVALWMVMGGSRVTYARRRELSRLRREQRGRLAEAEAAEEAARKEAAREGTEARAA